MKSFLSALLLATLLNSCSTSTSNEAPAPSEKNPTVGSVDAEDIQISELVNGKTVSMKNADFEKSQRFRFDVPRKGKLRIDSLSTSATCSENPQIKILLTPLTKNGNVDKNFLVIDLSRTTAVDLTPMRYELSISKQGEVECSVLNLSMKIFVSLETSPNAGQGQVSTQPSGGAGTSSGSAPVSDRTPQNS
jgi:hypothetical protein